MVTVTKSEMLKNLTSGSLLTLRVIVFGLIAGPTVMLGIIVFFFQNNFQIVELPPETANLLFLSHFGFLVFSAFVSWLIQNKNFKSMAELETAGQIVARYMSSSIIMMASAEGSAVFGMLVLFVNIPAGLTASPWIWSVLISYVWLIFAGLPLLTRTAEGTVKFIREKTGLMFY